MLSILALCVPAFALADGSPHARTLVGTLTANPSGSVTVASTTATLTCSVPDRALGAVAKLKLGGHFKITCRPREGSLMLVELGRVEVHGTSPGDHGTSNAGSGTTSTHGDTTTTETHPPATPPPPGGGDHSGTTTTGGGDHGGTTTTTGTTPTPPPPPPPPLPPHREGHGVVSALSSTGVTLTLDGGGPPLNCAITPAPDSSAAAAKLTLGAHFGIVCRLDGTHYVLSGATPITT